MLCYAVTATGIFFWFHFSIWNNTNANLWCQLNNSIFTSDIFALVSCRSWTLCIWCQRILSVPFNRSIVSFENWFKELPIFFSIDIELCTLLVVVLVARERNYHIMKKRNFYYSIYKEILSKIFKVLVQGFWLFQRHPSNFG